MKVTDEIVCALNRATSKMKTIEEACIGKQYRKDSAWLSTINDIIDRTALAIRDELENIS